MVFILLGLSSFYIGYRGAGKWKMSLLETCFIELLVSFILISLIK